MLSQSRWRRPRLDAVLAIGYQPDSVAEGDLVGLGERGKRAMVARVRGPETKGWAWFANGLARTQAFVSFSRPSSSSRVRGMPLDPFEVWFTAST